MGSPPASPDSTNYPTNSTPSPGDGSSFTTRHPGLTARPPDWHCSLHPHSYTTSLKDGTQASPPGTQGSRPGQLGSLPGPPPIDSKSRRRQQLHYPAPRPRGPATRLALLPSPALVHHKSRGRVSGISTRHPRLSPRPPDSPPTTPPLDSSPGDGSVYGFSTRLTRGGLPSQAPRTPPPPTTPTPVQVWKDGVDCREGTRLDREKVAFPPAQPRHPPRHSPPTLPRTDRHPSGQTSPTRTLADAAVRPRVLPLNCPNLLPPGGSPENGPSSTGSKCPSRTIAGAAVRPRELNPQPQETCRAGKTNLPVV